MTSWNMCVLSVRVAGAARLVRAITGVVQENTDGARQLPSLAALPHTAAG